MREIKFRAKGLRDHELYFLKGSYVKVVGNNFRFDNSTKHYIYPPSVNCCPVEVDIDTLGQFTGLKDKNGIESYQDDIISDGVKKYQIHFFKGMFVAVDIGLEVREENAYRIDYLMDKCNCIVIGNIHENPELKPELL